MTKHQMDLSGRGNKVRLVVRCRCMAQGPTLRHHWDYLAVVDTLDEAKAVYRKHLAESEAA